MAATSLPGARVAEISASWPPSSKRCRGWVCSPTRSCWSPASGGASFAARGFAGDTKQLVWLIQEAVKHPGYALLDVLQPCVTYNKINTYEWYRARIYKLEGEGDYDASDREQALKKSLEWGER